MKIATVSLINNTPLNTGGKSASFFVNNTIGKFNDLNFNYFYEEKNQGGEIPQEINFTTKYIKKKFKFSFLPDLLQKMNYEFLFSRGELKNIKTDVVLLEFPYLYHIAKIISHYNNKCPIVMLAHNIEHQYYKREGSKIWRLIKLYENFVLKKVDKILSISQHDYEYIKNFNKNVHLIKLGVSSEIYKPEGEFYNFDDSKFNILFYGSLKTAFNKNALNFIYNNLCPKLGDGFLVNVCGKNVDNIPDKDGIKFHGFVDKLEEYIRGCDVVIVPIKETVGVNMRILESLYCGKIVLASSASMQGLDNNLKRIVFKCDREEEYIKILEKLQKDNKYKKECEKNIKETAEKYIKDGENVLKNLFKG